MDRLCQREQGAGLTVGASVSLPQQPASSPGLAFSLPCARGTGCQTWVVRASSGLGGSAWYNRAIVSSKASAARILSGRVGTGGHRSGECLC